jgi:hypothetical protein
LKLLHRHESELAFRNFTNNRNLGLAWTRVYHHRGLYFLLCSGLGERECVCVYEDVL